MTLEARLAQLRTLWPDLEWSDARLEEYDHDVIHLDENWVFRFACKVREHEPLGLEIALSQLNEEAASLLEGDVPSGGPTTDRLRRLAMARYRCGRLADGMQASRAVLLQDRTCIRSLHNMVLASLMRGRLVHATAWLRRALASHPRDEGLRRLRIRLWAQRIVRRCGIGRSDD